MDRSMVVPRRASLGSPRAPRCAPELALADAGSQETPPAPSFPPDSNSSRTPACYPSLDYLVDELILSKPYGNTVQSRTSLSAQLPKRMAVAALLDLKNERALALKRSCAVQKSLRHGITAPGIHVRAPGRVAGEMRKCS